jgi:hypothetical protein
MSGRKNYLKQYTTISAGSMTGTAVITSAITDITTMDNIGYQFDWTSAPVGNFQVQVSSNHAQDAQGNVTVTGTWVPVVFNYWNGTTLLTATSIPTSVGTPIYLDCTQLSAPWIRCIYTNTSGTGTLTAVISGKMI